jgi:hypothetical protein
LLATATMGFAALNPSYSPNEPLDRTIFLGIIFLYPAR